MTDLAAPLSVSEAPPKAGVEARFVVEKHSFG